MLDARFYIANGPFSLAELTQDLAAELPDAKFADEMIFTASMLSNSQPGQLCFLDNKRHKSQADTAKATACFVTERLASIVGQQNIIPIVTKTPKAHFARALDKLITRRILGETMGDASIAKSANVHKSAVIGAGAVIGEDVTIAPYAVIGPGVEIGARSFIGAHTHIDCTLMGEDCHIKPGAVIGGAGFGVTADEKGIIDIPHSGRVVLGNRVSIGSQSCVDRGQLGDTLLEDDVKIDNLVQIAHNVQIGAGSALAGHVGISGSCIVGKGVQLGGNVGLADHIIVGDGASVAARAGVMHDIPAGEVWSGIPAMPIRDHMRLISATRKLSKKSRS